jgi:hypothetical protein
MNALKKGPASVRSNGTHKSTASASISPQNPSLTMDQIKKLVAELEVPFNPSVIEWRVMNITEDGIRGQLMPYADQRAYTDRLNELFTPAGWTRKYTVHTSANFERSDDHKVVAKVFVTCDLTIHGIGSHSATGEEWADDDNAGTSAEAQAFKRACSCFGLGRYLYYFTGIWVDLDDRQRPMETPQIFGWATPEGWRKGLRPPQRETAQPSKPATSSKRKNGSAEPDQNLSAEKHDLIQQIEAMAEPLGKALYRGLLKTVARVWKPGDIRDTAVLKKVLTSMQSGARGLRRLEAARDRVGPDALQQILSDLKLRSLEQVDNLDTLRQLVQALEDKADHVASA